MLALLEYNNSQGQLIESKHSDTDPAVPTVAEDAALPTVGRRYGSAREQINDPNLAATAIQVADAAASSSPAAAGAG